MNDREDLDEAIVHLIESIRLLSLTWLRHRSTILETLFLLANALVLRSNVSTQPDSEDAIYATKYLFRLRDQPHEIPGVSRHRVTALLVDALALQVKLAAENMMQNIREMAVLSHELLTLEASDVDTTHPIILIYTVVKSKIRAGVPEQPLDELIECLREARKRRPDLLEGQIAFAMVLASRYYTTKANNDYEEAGSTLDQIIAHAYPGNIQDKFVATAQESVTSIPTLLGMTQSLVYRTSEYLEEAICRTRTCFSSYFVKEFSFIVFDPEFIEEGRLSFLSSIEEVEALSNPLLSQLLVVSLMPEFSQTLDTMEDVLFGICDNGDTNTTKIDKAVDKGRSILVSYPHASILSILDLFGDILDEAFDRTKNIAYLNESISIRHQAIKTPIPRAMRFKIFSQLSQSLLARYQLFPGHHTQDLDDALELISQCVSDARGNFPGRLWLASQWALTARRARHPSISAAYETAMSLLQDTLFFSPTLQLQHTTLAALASTHILPLDYASYQVDLNQLEEAIETLERGRAVLWSEMRHLRTSIDQLLEVDPVLGHRFAAVNRDLEDLTKSVPPSHNMSMDDSTADGLRAVDSFGRLVLKQRDLLKERANLISQIQALPGFDSFLTSTPFDILRSAASSGPVIIINHSEWRSDILILLHNMLPSLIPTPDDFFKRAGALKDKLLDSRRKSGLDSKDYDETLVVVLAELYILVGKPVIDRLRQLHVREQSRIWWYPTSVFCYLPLHAMGPIPSDYGEPRYFLDLYICSYTPTLSALIQSRKRDSGSRSLDRPSILLVAQQDPCLPTVGGEVQVVQSLDTEVTSLISEAATPAMVIDGFHHHPFVHIATTSTLKPGNPFAAGFELHGGERLTLLQIVRLNLPDAEFAFLSACHSAEITEGSVVDEVLHLAAAVQYCGFRSVVGTMWAMADEDGLDLAEYFYEALFANPRGTPYHERSAKALRFAVKKLRRKRRTTLERWVNFVHYGA